MPEPYTVLKLESMREKGVEVEYPTAPWFEDYKAKKIAEADAIALRKPTIGETLVPNIPADRSEGTGWDKPKIEKEEIPKRIKYPLN